MIQIAGVPLPTHAARSCMECIATNSPSATQDMPARQTNGELHSVEWRRARLHPRRTGKLASAEHNLIFDPACLTEDYENGLRLHKMGCRQIFVPVTRRLGSIMATREFFPQRARSAIRQRTRWVTGIALQSWERHGWSGGFAEVYWFWRDARTVRHPISLFSNVLFAYGLLTWLLAKFTGSPWGLAQQALHPALLTADVGHPNHSDLRSDGLCGLALTENGLRWACRSGRCAPIGLTLSNRESPFCLFARADSPRTPGLAEDRARLPFQERAGGA